MALHQTSRQGKGFGSSLLSSQVDPRVSDIAHRMQMETPGPHGRPFGDPFRVGRPDLISFNYRKPVVVGRVLYAIPQLNWYHVRCGGGGGLVSCVQMAGSNTSPIGVRDSAMIAPGSAVLVQLDETSFFGVILGVLPGIQENPNVFRPGYVWPGSGTGPQREPVYAEFMRLLQSGANVVNAGSGGPLDSTSLDRGFITETGIHLHVDPFLTFYRVSPRTSILMSLFDEYMRIQAAQYDLILPTCERVSKNDEGELHDVERNFVFPWEAHGLYSPGNFGKRLTGAESQLTGYAAPVDLDPDARDVQPFARHTVYRGKLGNPYLEVVAVPGSFAGQQLYRDAPAGKAVYARSVGLAGEVLEQSVTSITRVKKPNIPFPKQTAVPESVTGDDRRAANYDFDDTLPQAGKPDAAVLAVDPLNASAYEANYAAVANLRRHRNDFSIREEKDSGPSQAVLDYRSLAVSGNLSVPAPESLQLDYQGTIAAIHALSSIVRQNEDGSISVADGTGCSITMHNGRLELAAPEGVYLRGGMRLVLMGNDVYVRAHDNVDVTASNKEVRIAAHKKIQVLGNSLLLESRGEETDIDYSGVGENAKSSGIILKSNTAVSLLGNGLVLRSGVVSTNRRVGMAADTGSGPRTGNIVIDAGRDNHLLLVGKSAQAYTTEGLSVRTSPSLTAKLGACYSFLPEGAFLGAALNVGGKISGYGRSGLAVEGDIRASGGISSGTRLSHTAKTIGTASSTLISDIQRQGAAIERQYTDQQSALPEAGLASDNTLTPLPVRDQLAIRFTFRDDGSQYRAGTDYSLNESRWEQLHRMGAATGVRPWTEQLLADSTGVQAAFPGYSFMTGDSGIRRIDKAQFFDYAAGHADSTWTSSREAGSIESVGPQLNLGTI